MNTNHRRWRWVDLIFVLSFEVLGYLGWLICRTAPPIPQTVVSNKGDVLFLHADHLLKPAFWGMNLGLAMMVFLSLLPAGIYQAWASVSRGLWYAHSPEIIHSPVMEALVWLHVPGDVVFAAGALMLAAYAMRLLRRPPPEPVCRAAPSLN